METNKQPNKQPKIYTENKTQDNTWKKEKNAAYIAKRFSAASESGNETCPFWIENIVLKKIPTASAAHWMMI